MIITYKERHFIDKYTCRDYIKTFCARTYFVPRGTSLYYFKINDFSYRTICADDLISIEN